MRSHTTMYRAGLLATICASVLQAGIAKTAGAQEAQPPADPHKAFITVPGVPNKPDLVTVVPFYEKPNETANEKTKVIIPAWVDSVFGLFVVDLGAPRLNMNRTFLQPSPKGGVDTVTEAHKIPDDGSTAPVHVKVRIGTLTTTPIDPIVASSDPKQPNAFLDHMWGNFAWVFAPRLGNLGLSVLEPFETIVDYTHKRLILIRLDSAGHRMVDVPAYKPKWTAPLIDMPMAGDARKWWGIKVKPDMTLDTANTANNTQTMAMDTGAGENGELLGYPFLSQFGVVGFNHRTHQFILYH